MTGPIIAFAATDPGLRRRHNEDAFLLDTDLHCYLLADGMGGAQGGEVAAQMAVRCVRDDLAAQRQAFADDTAPEAPDAHPLFSLFGQAVRRANQAIHRRADDEPGLTGMGTTLTGITFAGGYAFLAHVGDSRAYRIRGQEIEQLSEDHTYINEMLKAGVISEEDAVRMPWQHVLARAVGVEHDVRVDVRAFPTQPGDLFVLCSDGLANVVEPDEIRDAVLETNMRSAPERLIRLANDRGGPDNITVLVVAVHDAEANDDLGDRARRSA